MSEDEILAIIKRHPEVIAEALESKPELLTSLIIKFAPWDKFATKEDIKMLIELIDKRFNDVNKRFEDVNKRFEDINKRFESIDKRFEDMNKRFESIDKRFEELISYSDRRFEDINKRFEDLKAYSDKRFEDLKTYSDKRFEDMMHYVDRRFDEVNRRLTAVERIMLSFNIPILIAILTMLIKTFIG